MNMRYSGILLCCYLLIAAPLSMADSLQPVWEGKQLQSPESVIYDKRTNQLFVSNISGAPNEKNGKGFISTLALDGSVIELNWLEGLHAPKGLAIVGNTLYVSDIDQLVEIDINQGKIIKRHMAPEAKFLNDVVAASATKFGDALGAYYGGVASTIKTLIDSTKNRGLVKGFKEATAFLIQEVKGTSKRLANEWTIDEPVKELSIDASAAHARANIELGKVLAELHDKEEAHAQSMMTLEERRIELLEERARLEGEVSACVRDPSPFKS